MTFVGRRGGIAQCAILLCTIALRASTMAAKSADRRIVDLVLAGDIASESTHGYVGLDAVTGDVDGKPYRLARSWMRYAMTTFDDTPVTLSCTFVGKRMSQDHDTLTYDVIVEDSVIATRTFIASSQVSTVAEITVPFVLTKGKVNVSVMFRAHGRSTPALKELRTVQDHNEFQ